MAGSLRVILVSAEPLALRGLCDHVSRQSDIAVVALATTAEEAVSSATSYLPDLLFFQPERFPNAGLDLSTLLRKRFPNIKLVIVTHRTEIEVVLAYARLGVAAYFMDDDIDELAEDLAGLGGGRVVLGRRLAHALSELFSTPLGQTALGARKPTQGDLDAGGDMSQAQGPRIQTILRLVGRGLTNKEIGRRLGIRESTVVEHLKRYRARVGPLPRAMLGRGPGDANTA